MNSWHSSIYRQCIFQRTAPASIKSILNDGVLSSGFIPGGTCFLTIAAKLNLRSERKRTRKEKAIPLTRYQFRTSEDSCLIRAPAVPENARQRPSCWLL
jgi:hypothetical protein